MTKHDKEVITKFANWLDNNMGCLNAIDIDYDWDEEPYETYHSYTVDELITEYEGYLEEWSDIDD